MSATDTHQIDNMPMSVNDGLLSNVVYVRSPNQSSRPEGCAIDLLVIHNISLPPGKFETGFVDQFFCNTLDSEAHPFFKEIASLKVSAHLLIERSGKITQYVPFTEKAWHAGESSFGGRANCNEYSIGIELEGTDFEAFTDAQYRVLITVTALLQQEYPCLNLDRIVGHSDIAPGRKTDPGPFFDWPRYRAAIGSD